MVTLHSIKRTEERAGVNASAATKMIMNAFSRGLDYDKFGAQERKYMLMKSKEGSYAKYYSGYCFIFNADDICVTMYKVPTWFGKNRFSGKIKIRNPRKCYRYHLIKDDQEDLQYKAV